MYFSPLPSSGIITWSSFFFVLLLRKTTTTKKNKNNRNKNKRFDAYRYKIKVTPINSHVIHSQAIWRTFVGALFSCVVAIFDFQIRELLRREKKISKLAVPKSSKNQNYIYKNFNMVNQLRCLRPEKLNKTYIDWLVNLCKGLHSLLSE